MFFLTDQDIDPQELSKLLADPKAGALSTFEGWVRNHHKGQGVLKLHYQAYNTLAKKEGMRVINEAKHKFEILSAVVVHRVGELDIGGVAVWVGVSSEHRQAGLEACRFIIDEIKKSVPIWKKEFYKEGSSEWVAVHHSNQYV